jgi:hypothetical protein
VRASTALGPSSLGLCACLCSPAKPSAHQGTHGGHAWSVQTAVSQSDAVGVGTCHGMLTLSELDLAHEQKQTHVGLA